MTWWAHSVLSSQTLPPLPLPAHTCSQLQWFEWVSKTCTTEEGLCTQTCLGKGWGGDILDTLQHGSLRSLQGHFQSGFAQWFPHPGSANTVGMLAMQMPQSGDCWAPGNIHYWQQSIIINWAPCINIAGSSGPVLKTFVPLSSPRYAQASQFLSALSTLQVANTWTRLCKRTTQQKGAVLEVPGEWQKLSRDMQRATAHHPTQLALHCYKVLVVGNLPQHASSSQPISYKADWCWQLARLSPPNQYSPNTNQLSVAL